MKRIEIDKRDVYRAKHDIITDEESLFYESYKKAAIVLKEIIKESQSFGADFDLGKDRMTNNIILFDGGRGYGKTTAMQSFSAFLEESKKNVAPIFQFKANFLCIDTIDPSCMNSKESIVRVVLTYLFSLVMPKLKRIKADDYCANMLKVEILDHFQTCYSFIDYLNGFERNMDFMPDDIEYISRLGNSNELKKEIWELIQKIIKLIGKEKAENKEKKERGIDCSKKNLFLILKIDDADLSTSSTFKLCDEIRSYFSLPNLVIIMAGSLEYIRNNILEEYISKSKVFWEEGRKRYTVMAARYVEKMFPQGHVIRLPRLDEVLLNQSEDLKLEYHGKNKKDFGVAEDDIQDQLLRELYMRTGVLLVRPENRLHVFLPHTMRELTHFVKMIYEMEIIDFKSILNVWAENERALDDFAMKELEKARENLSTFSQYFMDYWCPLKLRESDVEKIQQMHLRGLRDSKYSLMAEEGDIDSRTIADYIYYTGVNEKQKVAYIIFYTIHCFLQLYDSLANKTLMREFIDFSDKEFSFSEQLYYGEKEDRDNYQLWRFNISNKLLTEVIQNTASGIYPAKVFYNIFCGTQNAGEEVFEIRNSKIVLIDNSVSLKFDLMKSLKRLLCTYFWQISGDKSIGEKSSTVENELGVNVSNKSIEKKDDSSEEQAVLGQDKDLSSNILYPFFLYLGSIEFQKVVNDQIFSSMQNAKYDIDLMQLYGKAVGEIDGVFNCYPYLSGISGISKEVGRYFNSYQQETCNLFFSNKGNLGRVLKEYVEILNANIEKIKGYTSIDHILEVSESEFDSFVRQLEWNPAIIKYLVLDDGMKYNKVLGKMISKRKKICDIVEKIRGNCIFGVALNKQDDHNLEIDSEITDKIKVRILEYHSELENLAKDVDVFYNSEKGYLIER